MTNATPTAWSMPIYPSLFPLLPVRLREKVKDGCLSAPVELNALSQWSRSVFDITHTHTQPHVRAICNQRKNNYKRKCTNTAFKQKVKVQFGLRPNTLRLLLLFCCIDEESSSIHSSQLALCAACRVQQTKHMCVRCSEIQQTNKTQPLNAKQVFLVCSFPPPWPKPKPKAQPQSSPTQTQYTHIPSCTGIIYNINGNNCAHCCLLWCRLTQNSMPLFGIDNLSICGNPMQT